MMMVFNDGYIQGVKIRNGKIEKDLTARISCHQTTVGLKRFYTAQTANYTIDKVVCVPIDTPIVMSMHIEARFFRGIGSDKPYIYKIVQLQEIFEKHPPYIQLSLQKVNTEYDDLRG